MAKIKESDFEQPIPIVDDEDESTLAAIDRGIEDAKSGLVVSDGHLRELLPKWISMSSTPKKR